MPPVDKIQKLVDEFVACVVSQTESIRAGDWRTGNKFAKRYIAAFAKLRKIGDSGREGLTQLFKHPNPDVRTMAAAFLLRYATKRAMKVLRTEALGEGFTAFEASECIKRWNEGANTLDPEE